MQQVIQGIIIHSIRYSDHRFIARIFCHSHGLKTFLVSGGSKQRSGVINLLQPLNIVEFESAPRENTQIQTLKNLRMSHALHQIHADPVKSAMVMFLNEVIYKTMADDYINDHFYLFLRNAVVLLDDSIDARNFHIWCLLEISRHYGFYPQKEKATEFFDLSQSAFVKDEPPHPYFIANEESMILADLLDLEWPQVQQMAMHGNMRKNLLHSLVTYIKIHLENQREIHSLEILHEVFH